MLHALGACRRSRSADRKSTRLNSSHTLISYAVFCLKKKNSGKSASVCPVTIPEEHHADDAPRDRATHHFSAFVFWSSAPCPSPLPGCFFFLNNPAPPEINTLPLPAALPI